jgi:2-aminoethylphosphonate-pyruvate transaminase
MGLREKNENRSRAATERYGINMDMHLLPENPYLLLTPGPLSTSKTVKGAMLRDWCTWDDEYKELVEDVRRRLLTIASLDENEYTTVLMQGSGTFANESVIGSVIPDSGKLLVLSNGAYGERLLTIARMLKIPAAAIDFGYESPIDIGRVNDELANNRSISHVAFVHCETTTGILNGLDDLCTTIKRSGKILILDAMSSFAGIPIDIKNLGIDFLISSANKCVQGVPGFGFIIALRRELSQCSGRARSHSLDLYDQWASMDKDRGKWRFTSPTHTVRAFHQALIELEEEGGIESRFRRYAENQRVLVRRMAAAGFAALLPERLQSPIITTFLCPESPDFSFEKLYTVLKESGFVIYPGKVTDRQVFRIGNIGEVHPSDMDRLVDAIENNRFW